MLQIRLNKGPSADGGGPLKPSPADTITVACPDHLVLADLPVAKGIGTATAATLVKTVGRRSRRQLGERVHFCVRCDFPIAIYGRLSPCDHAFCLDCARSESICYLCDERIQKIQTIKIMEGIFICAAPHCLKSFVKKAEFESHIHEKHTNLLQSDMEREEGREFEMQSAKHSTGADPTYRAPPRTALSPGSNPHIHDNEDKARRQQPSEQFPHRQVMNPKGPQMFGHHQNYSSEPQHDTGHPPGFDRPVPRTRFHQGFDRQGTPQRESSHFADKQQGFSENQFSDYPPVNPMHPSNFSSPMNSNPGLAPYGIPPFATEGNPPFFAPPLEMARANMSPDISEHGSLLGFPSGPIGGMNYTTNYHQHWNSVQPGMLFEGPPAGPGMAEAFLNFSGDFGRNPGGLPPPVPSAKKGMDAMQTTDAMEHKDGKGVLAPQKMQAPPPPPPLPPHMSQHRRGKYHSIDMRHDDQSFGYEKRDPFRGSQE